MPVGGIIGAALGAWLAWRTVRGLEGRAAMAAGFGLAGFAALGGAGWYGLTLYERGSPYEAGEEPTVLIEWRLPDIVPPSDIVNYRHTMRSTFKDWTLNTEWDDPVAREEDGRTVLRFRGEIRWRRAGRIFQLWKFPADNERITVELNLGADPQAADSYGPWKEVSAAPGHAFRTRVLR
ncbi:MAG: hypothetical protein JJ913_10425 [Rhizobiaceae bacterium]|nr:hypothetical protein [Rhizobiaceae bacterium]